ncbi:ATP-binding protein [Mycoplasmopsis felis]|uniref:ATP-binding protein n=1 Tax=Mycoplasmopsis felis TaxID=33923 RepID=UPI002AF6B039|nr:ATP-binding protein [Mycoplasmopsis felis]WQQ02827.1 ATP-binding protein [Mycoplasmopsis felis]WQQ10046.1 ATP-binding protein [Mycoplasmopsis felis]
MNVNRDFYLNKLISKMHNNKIKILTGIRRCGKSYLLFNLFKEYLISQNINSKQIITISLEDIENIELRNPIKLNNFIKSKIENNHQYYAFIDEIQMCSGIKNPYVENGDQITFVDTLLALMKIKNLDIYITGSNSKMLSSQVLTQFRGRGDRIHVNPFSFKEINGLFENNNTALEHYLVYGGMPYIYSLSNFKDKNLYLKDLFDHTYISDILERNKLKNNKEIIEILLDFVSSNIGSLTNPTKLSNRFLSEKKINLASKTILKYLDCFQESYLISKADRYDVKGSRYFSTPVKYYFSDVGLRNARLNFRQIEYTHLMENIIYNELLARDYNVDVGVVEIQSNIDNKRKKVQLEIDFVVNLGHKKFYIQSAFNIESEQKREQETLSLRKINDSFKKIVVLKDNIIPYHDDNGIYYVGLIQFLLDESVMQ